LVSDRFAEGEPGAITASLAHVPELLCAISPFLRAIYGPSAISPRLKEIAVLRVSVRMQCRFCTQTHTAVARRSGLSRDEVVALRGRAPAETAFSDPRERALVRWAEAMALGPDPVAPAIMSLLAESFADHEVVELAMIASATMMLARYCTALELPPSAATLEQLRAEELL